MNIMSGSVRSVAFLRGINVGGHRVTKDELIAVFDELGFTEISTFLASGNVLFCHDGSASGEPIAEALKAALGYGVPTTLRSATEIAAIADDMPFSPADIGASTGKPQVMLLFAEPTEAARSEVMTLATSDDLLAFSKTELYWLPSLGVSGTDLDLKRIEKLVGPTTTRTTNTISRLLPKL